jgi:hypothetical protein
MSDDSEKLEQLVDRLARAQPARRAPVSLQARVFAQIASQRAQLPWWRKGFAHWPQVARALFLIASYGFIRLAIAGVMWVVDFVRSSSLGSVLHAIPPMWLYGGATFGFALYAVLFGLSTFAYRTLYVQR